MTIYSVHVPMFFYQWQQFLHLHLYVYLARYWLKKKLGIFLYCVDDVCEYVHVLVYYIHWQYILDCLLIKYQYTMSCKHYKLKFVMSERSNVSGNLKSCGYISAIPDSPKIPKFDRLLFRNFLNWNLLNIKLGNI